MSNKVIKWCENPKCGKMFQLGKDGIWKNDRKRFECDQCAGVTRDSRGCAWEDEDELGGLTREEAFK